MNTNGLITGAAIFMAAAVSTFAQSAPTTTETPKWSTSGAAGLSISSGNTENTLLNGNVTSSRKWSMNEIDLGVDGAYGESDGERNTAVAHAFGQYNRLFSERFYGTTAATQRDPVAAPPPGAPASLRVVRGGSWAAPAWACRAASREGPLFGCCWQGLQQGRLSHGLSNGCVSGVPKWLARPGGASRWCSITTRTITRMRSTGR